MVNSSLPYKKQEVLNEKIRFFVGIIYFFVKLNNRLP